MRSVLVYPPRSGPTYMPLGVACLSAVLPDRDATDIFDANLELWNSLCDADCELAALRAFSRGPLGIFLNAEVYAARWGKMPIARRRIELLERQARGYLAGEGLEPELRELLVRQCRRMESGTPEIVAFSAMYLDQLPFLLAAAQYWKEELRAPGRIVVGGAAMTALVPAELLKAAPFLDIILVGEGEISLPALLSGRSPELIPGCVYRSGGGIATTGAPVVPPVLGELPRPDFQMLAGGGYFNPVPVMPIYSSRGCKWRRCRFCAHNNSFGCYRQRPPAAVAMEMRESGKLFGCRHFYFVDQYVDPLYLDALCDAILELGVDCRFQVMARTLPEYSRALLEKAAQAGCCWISWGMESGSQRLLEQMQKGTRVAEARTVIKNAAEFGISNLLMMIFGVPGSDSAAMEETFTFLEEVWDDIDGMTASAFVLFDQTDYGRRPAKYGLELLERRPILSLRGGQVFDMKLPFRRTGELGRGESPWAAHELDQWERRKVWLPELPFHGRLCCEHYLLYADSQQAHFLPRTHLFSA